MVATAVETFHKEEIAKNIFATGWDGNIVLTASADGVYEVATNIELEAQDPLPLFAADGGRSRIAPPARVADVASAPATRAASRAPPDAGLRRRALANRSTTPSPSAVLARPGVTSEYKLVQGTEPADLQAQVTKQLQAGWTPTGGVATHRLGDGKEILLQALIRQRGMSGPGQ